MQVQLSDCIDCINSRPITDIAAEESIGYMTVFSAIFIAGHIACVRVCVCVCVCVCVGGG